MFSQSQIARRSSYELALEAYSQQYGFNDILEFRDCSLRDLLDTIVRLEQERAVQRKTRFNIKSRLASLIAFVERYAAAIDCIAQTTSGSIINPAALIWGTIRVLLEIVSSATRYMKNVLNLLENLGKTVSLYEVYEDMFSDHERFQDALVKVYIDIILILGKARKVFRQGKHRMLVRCFKSNFETDFRDEIRSMEQDVALLKSETTLAHRIQMHEFVAETKRSGQFSNTKSDEKSTMIKARACAAFKRLVKTDETMQKIQQWLNPTDCASRYAGILSDYHSGTGSWFLENKTYLDWKFVRHERLLWVTGRPGVGKTVLSSVLIEDVRRSSTQPTMAYFHCDASNECARSEVGVFASILSQIAADIQMRHPQSIPDCLIEVYERSLSFGRSSFSLADDPVQALLNLLAICEDTVLVIDGLDELEIPEGVIRSLTSILHEADNLRIAFFSRDITGIRNLLVHEPRVEITGSNVENDIRLYVAHHSVRIPGESVEDRQAIITEISDRAEGMFLWARMVIEDLSTATNYAEIKQMLQKCPKGLDGIYNHFLGNLSRQSAYRQKLAKDVIQWVCCSTRRLTVDELKSALSTSVTCGQIETDKRPFHSVIVELCNPFIRVTESGKYIQTVHHSIREYLLDACKPGKTNPASEFLIYQPEAHADIAMRCLQFLKLLRSNSTDIGLDNFCQYAMVSWHHHVVRGAYNANLEAEISALLSRPHYRQDWLYYMFFYNHVPFAFNETLQLQEKLQEWSAKRSENDRGAVVWDSLALNLSMDVIELLIGLDDDRGSIRGSVRPDHHIKYFDKMMVMRSIARRLTGTGQLTQAVDKLEGLSLSQPMHDGGGNKSGSKMCQLTFLLNTLGVLYDQQGRVELAMHTQRKALVTQESRLGRSHPKTLWTVNEMGRIYRHLGQLTESEAMHRRALQGLSPQRSLDDDGDDEDPERVWTINTLGSTLRKQGRASEALRLHRRAYEARRGSLGALHVLTLWVCGDVAKCYRDLGRREEALEWFQRATDGRRETLGLRHPDTLWSANDLGVVLAELGRTDEALKTQREALEAQEKLLGAEHRTTLWTRQVVEELVNLSEKT